MLTQDELEKIYQENFPVGISLEAAAPLAGCLFCKKGAKSADQSRIVDEYTLADWFLEYSYCGHSTCPCPLNHVRYMKPIHVCGNIRGVMENGKNNGKDS